MREEIEWGLSGKLPSRKIYVVFYIFCNYT
jgi:hypothetical protein